MNEVRVYNADGTLVRVISKKEVTKLHWDKLVNSKGKKNVFHPAKNKTTTCENCDKKFPIIKGKVFKFCSPECRATGTSKKPKMEKACIKCGNMFLPKSSNMLYCHAQCVRKGKR